MQCFKDRQVEQPVMISHVTDRTLIWQRFWLNVLRLHVRECMDSLSAFPCFTFSPSLSVIMMSGHHYLATSSLSH